jgi:hypothetical protein
LHRLTFYSPNTTDEASFVPLKATFPEVTNAPLQIITIVIQQLNAVQRGLKLTADRLDPEIPIIGQINIPVKDLRSFHNGIMEGVFPLVGCDGGEVSLHLALEPLLGGNPLRQMVSLLRQQEALHAKYKSTNERMMVQLKASERDLTSRVARPPAFARPASSSSSSSCRDPQLTLSSRFKRRVFQKAALDPASKQDVLTVPETLTRYIKDKERRKGAVLMPPPARLASL